MFPSAKRVGGRGSSAGLALSQNTFIPSPKYYCAFAVWLGSGAIGAITAFLPAKRMARRLAKRRGKSEEGPAPHNVVHLLVFGSRDGLCDSGNTSSKTRGVSSFPDFHQNYKRPDIHAMVGGYPW